MRSTEPYNLFIGCDGISLILNYEGQVEELELNKNGSSARDGNEGLITALFADIKEGLWIGIELRYLQNSSPLEL